VVIRAHDHCFGISSGSHHGVRCLNGCHTSLPVVTFTGACGTGTYDCTDCHSHSSARSNMQHTAVPGYEYANQRCKQCHVIQQ